MNITGLLHIGDFFVVLILWAIWFAIDRLVLKFVHILPIKAVKSTSFTHKLKIVLWIFFALLSVLYLANKSLLLTVFLLVAVALALWSFWRDFFAYIVIQFNNELKENEKIKWKDLTGTVKQITTRNLYLETDDGKMEIIPLHLFTTAAYTKLQQVNKPVKYSFYVQDLKQPEEIKKKLFMSPWVIKHLPIIIEKQDNAYKVTCYTFDKNTSLKIGI